jgi:hypothetical protein
MSENKPIEFIHKYEITNHPLKQFKEVKILLKDGQAVKCHKVPSQLVPTQIEGQYAKEYELCSTHCSRAIIGVQDGNLFYCQNCEANNIKFAVSNVQIEPAKPKLELLK